MNTFSLRTFLIGLGVTAVSGAGAYTQVSLASGDHLPAWLVFATPLIVMALKDAKELGEKYLLRHHIAQPTVTVTSPATVTVPTPDPTVVSVPTIAVTPVPVVTEVTATPTSSQV